MLARWVRSSSADSETSIQFWADRSERSGQIYSVRLDAIDAELQHRRMLTENNELYLGAGYRLTTDNLIGKGAFQFRAQSRTDSVPSLTIRDEYQMFSRRLSLSAGIRSEHNAYTGFEWQPSVRLLYTPSKGQSLWASWSRAVRIPSRFEHDTATLPLGKVSIEGLPVLLDYYGNQSFAAERLQEWAAGYRYQHRQRWSIDLNLFRNRYTRLSSDELGPLLVQFNPGLDIRQTFYTGNGRYGLSRGSEIAASGSIKAWWKLHGSYSLLDAWSRVNSGSTDPSGVSKGEEPRHQFKARSMWNLSQRWQFDISAYAIDKIPAYEVAGQVRIDTRLGFRPNRTHDFSFIVQDLLNRRHIEFHSLLYGYAVAVQRSMTIRWTVRF